MKNPRGWLLVIVVLGIAARARLMWSTPWVPGINGAYYLVQVRAVLERGTLGLPDMPLTFYLQAGVAWLLGIVRGGTQSENIIFAVKLCDSVLPPLVALPVFMLTQRWAARLGRGPAIPLAAAAIVAMGFPPLGMLGDFQKNSLALLWLGMLCVALESWLQSPSRSAGLRLLACLALLGLTHIGVLGTALLLTTTVIAAALALGGLGQWRTRTVWLAGAAAVLAIAAGIVLWKFDAGRIHRLLTAMTDPAAFASDGVAGPGGPGGPALLRYAAAIVFILLVAPALVVIYRARRSDPAPHAAVAAGCALTVIVLTGPWFSVDKLMRFALIAVIPTVLASAYALLRVTRPRVRCALVAIALAILVGGSVPRVLHGGRPIFTDEALAELAGLKPLIADPERTLISAQHGAEWWTAWLLRTHIAHASALRPADWTRFDVLYLQVKSGLQMGPGGGSGRGPFGAPPDGHGDPGMPPMFGPMRAAPIPDDAQILHDGPHLKLARVKTPPPSVMEKQ